ncbi:amyloid-beta precursor protein-like [Clavelina lepadiformis]|uniref:amyloid-beta precursor protein-like n=1 Tax=Clavelina lepadiformis TaxID=159417 RepID=UPI00404349EF
MVFQFWTLLFLIGVSFAEIKATSQDSFVPAIAMVCGKNTQYRGLSTGEWVTDPTGEKDCMDTPEKILAYCQEVYPDLRITSTEKGTKVKVNAWCALGNRGPKCKGHAHSVTPFTCVVGPNEAPALTVPSGCSFQHVKNSSLCQDRNYWVNAAHERCQDMEMELQDGYTPIEECATSAWHGIELVCCPDMVVPSKKKAESKPVPKAPLDPICSLPKVIGMCRAAFQAFYYNTESGQCEHFIYGGCGGNENNFPTMGDCMKKCHVDDPLLDLSIFQGLGPVMLGNPQKPETQESTTTETTTTTTTSSKNQSPVSYFDTGLDPENELELFMNGKMDQVKQHQAKLAQAMSDWDAAKDHWLTSRGSPAEKDKINSDYQQMIDALDTELTKQLQQLTDVHQARLDAILVNTRQSNYHNFLQELNAEDPVASHVLRAFRHYLNDEQRDQQHVMHHLNRDQEEPSAPTAVLPKLQARLSAIQNRVHGALNLIQQHPDIADDIQDDIDSLMEGFLPSVSLDLDNLSDGKTKEISLEVDESEAVMIDQGGLPAEVDEEVDVTEEVDEEYYDDDDDEEYDYDDDDEYISDQEVEALTPNIEVEERVEDDEYYDDDDEDDELNLDSDDNSDDVEELDVDDDDEDDYVEDDDDKEDNYLNLDIDKYYPVDPQPLYIADVHKSYSEYTWLRWMGIFGGCLLLTVIVLGVLRYYQVKKHRSQKFARVQVDDHLTPEERQLLQMQQNGYENPTYKFFEKQQLIA